MSEYPIIIFYSNEDEGYIAEIPDLEYCSAFGKTLEEAQREIQIAKKAWVKTALAKGRPVPTPGDHLRRTKSYTPSARVSAKTSSEADTPEPTVDHELVHV
jgi:predicted RNase H-like HicB family nuclease